MLPTDTGLSVPAVQDTYLNANSLDSVKAMGRNQDPQALKEVAKKFESMFVAQMLKSMREANDVFADGNYFDSSTTRFHRDMLDQQMVLNLTSGRGMGLADHFYEQMMSRYGDRMKSESAEGEESTTNSLGELSQAVRTRETKANEEASDVDEALIDELYANNIDSFNAWASQFMQMANEKPEPANEVRNATPYAAIPALIAKPRATKSPSVKAPIANDKEQFVNLLRPHAEQAGKALNVNPDVLIAQVALETGWGQHVIHNQRGENSHNLFNIKANTAWSGKRVNVNTLEYRHGVAAYERADFRRYDNYAESFADYVDFIKNNPRYEKALEVGKDSASYAAALQRAGYATDPQYARKIQSLLKTELISSVAKTAQALASGVVGSHNTLTE